MTFFDYDRITDVIYRLSSDITLNFVVALSRKDKDGTRRFFHTEISYESKYIGRQTDRSIKRNLRFYYIIDVFKSFEDSIMIRPQEVPLLVMSLEKNVLPWFFSSKNVFSIIENKLVIKGEYTPMSFVFDENHWLGCTPTVMYYEKENSYKEGVTLYFNSKEKYIDVSIDTFMGFYWLLKKTDMYSAACNLLTYVKTEPYDVNTWINKPGLGSGGGMYADPDSYMNTNKSVKSSDFLNKVKKK